MNEFRSVGGQQLWLCSLKFLLDCDCHDPLIDPDGVERFDSNAGDPGTNFFSFLLNLLEKLSLKIESNWNLPQSNPKIVTALEQFISSLFQAARASRLRISCGHFEAVTHGKGRCVVSICDKNRNRIIKGLKQEVPCRCSL